MTGTGQRIALRLVDVGQAEDVAALVAFLVGPQAGFITGQNFVLDGGMVHTMINA